VGAGNATVISYLDSLLTIGVRLASGRDDLLCRRARGSGQHSRVYLHRRLLCWRRYLDQAIYISDRVHGRLWLFDAVWICHQRRRLCDWYADNRLLQRILCSIIHPASVRLCPESPIRSILCSICWRYLPHLNAATDHGGPCLHERHSDPISVDYTLLLCRSSRPRILNMGNAADRVRGDWVCGLSKRQYA
jgi:hypothetical protein